MSAIAGIVEGSGRPANEHLVRSMLAAMAPRAPDGTAVLSAGRAALGHGALRTLPEDEAQPIEEDGLLISADARIDNREELGVLLGVSDPTISDARLILRAYRRWGEGCADRLLGDFAFVIWDSKEQTLFAARDFIGVKPLFLHCGNHRLILASAIYGVLAEGTAPRHIVEARLAEFLAGLAPPADQTLYADVQRLPPAHWLKFKDGGLTLRRYWRAPEGPGQPVPDAPQAFAELMGAAVKARLRSTSAPGAMLSGGLDSSAIACLARPLTATAFGAPLPTFSVVFDRTPDWNERPYIEAALATGSFDAHFIDGHGLSAVQRLENLLAAQGGPFLAPNLELTSEVYRASAAAGVRVLLSGHGGDEVVSQGFGRLRELAKAGRWGKLWRESRAAANLFGEPAIPTFLRYFEQFGPGRRLPYRLRRALQKASGPAVAPPPWGAIINPDLIERAGLRELRREALEAASAASTQREAHLAEVDARQQSYGLEILDRAAAEAGVEVRFPFWDRRLLEFCLRLPGEEILDGGWPRRILRRGMEGILPPMIQWRRDKLDFTPHVVIDLLDRHGGLLDEVIVSDAQDMGQFIDLAGAREALERLRRERERASGLDFQLVWRSVAFAVWLKSERARPQGLQLA